MEGRYLDTINQICESNDRLRREIQKLEEEKSFYMEQLKFLRGKIHSLNIMNEQMQKEIEDNRRLNRLIDTERIRHLTTIEDLSSANNELRNEVKKAKGKDLSEAEPFVFVFVDVADRVKNDTLLSSLETADQEIQAMLKEAQHFECLVAKCIPIDFSSSASSSVDEETSKKTTLLSKLRERADHIINHCNQILEVAKKTQKMLIQNIKQHLLLRTNQIFLHSIDDLLMTMEKNTQIVETRIKRALNVVYETLGQSQSLQETEDSILLRKVTVPQMRENTGSSIADSSIADSNRFFEGALRQLRPLETPKPDSLETPNQNDSLVKLF